MSRKGSEIVQFRVTPELSGALQAFAEKHELETVSAAARVLLMTALGMEEGASPQDAARKAVIDEAIWSVHRIAQEVMRTELVEFGGVVAAKIKRRLRAA